MTDYNLRSRAARIRRILSTIDDDMEQIQKAATISAVQKAAELTPPTLDNLSGTNTRTGAMKQHWATDSRILPLRTGNDLSTALKNNQQYASYVNDGHRMDRHFVPGLVINPYSGLLEFNPDGKGGIVVGTRTNYVQGLFMVDKAIEVWREHIRTELSRLMREAEQ